jgi:hypothetical protein
VMQGAGQKDVSGTQAGYVVLRAIAKVGFLFRTP